MDAGNLKKTRLHIGKHRRETDGDKGLYREGDAETLPGEIEKRQVEQEEGKAEIHAKSIVQQEGDAGRTPGEKPGAGEHIKAECRHEAAGEYALHIFERVWRVALVFQKPRAPMR
ncbi:hypothetical protein AJ87_05420 [Rhizobium yanglingense]|nr:hypothetical protein AJ87_05420 [Rhizobium yanglingense]